MDNQAQMIAQAIQGARGLPEQIIALQETPSFLLQASGDTLYYAGHRYDVRIGGSVATVIALTKTELVEKGPDKKPPLDSRFMYNLLYSADYAVLLDEEGNFVPLQLLCVQDGIFVFDYSVEG